MDMKTASLEKCIYDKERKVLSMHYCVLGMPNQFFLESHYTGEVVRFKCVDEYDILFDQDQWDGEMQVYRPIGNVPGVDHLCIHV